MWTKLIVTDYQSIVSANLDLGPVTLIVGPNASGKSAILRALHALCFNQTGDEFIRDGEEGTVVVIHWPDSTVIWRKKRKESASYSGIIGGDHMTFLKTGRNVPDEISSALGVGVVEVDSTWVVKPQFQMQWDTPLVAESGSRIARILGLLTHLDVIIKAQMESKRDRDRAKREQTNQTERADEFQVTKDGLAWATDTRTTVDHLHEARQVAEATDDAIGVAAANAELLGALQKVVDGRAEIQRVGELLAGTAVEIESLSVVRTLNDGLTVALMMKPRYTAKETEARSGLEEITKEYQDACEQRGICSICPWR